MKRIMALISVRFRTELHFGYTEAYKMELGE